MFEQKNKEAFRSCEFLEVLAGRHSRKDLSVFKYLSVKSKSSGCIVGLLDRVLIRDKERKVENIADIKRKFEEATESNSFKFKKMEEQIDPWQNKNPACRDLHFSFEFESAKEIHDTRNGHKASNHNVNEKEVKRDDKNFETHISQKSSIINFNENISRSKEDSPRKEAKMHYHKDDFEKRIERYKKSQGFIRAYMEDLKVDTPMKKSVSRKVSFNSRVEVIECYTLEVKTYT